jgi:hypothetical protein
VWSDDVVVQSYNTRKKSYAVDAFVTNIMVRTPKLMLYNQMCMHAASCAQL